MHPVICSTAVAILCLLNASASAGGVADRPFGEKLVVVPHIHVESNAQFQPWSGGSVGIGNYDSRYFERTRVGTVLLAPGFKAHIDEIWDKVHFPSYYELVASGSGEVLGKYPVKDLVDAEWYFPGNGSVYVNQSHLGLCGPRYTRKFILSAKSLLEASQPIAYVGVETEALETTPLFESPVSKTVVATIVPKTKVNVIGVQTGVPDDHAALLVKTPFGLTGWHRRKGIAGEGSLELYQCN